MPRPCKRRRVCKEPRNRGFHPENIGSNEVIILGVDEFETIRLIDLEDYTQEECANQMDVARTTVQSIYNNARRKIADAIVNGKAVQIKGGEYLICSNLDTNNTKNKECNYSCKNGHRKFEKHRRRHHSHNKECLREQYYLNKEYEE